MKLTKPWVQVSIDVWEVEHGMRLAQMAEKAGVGCVEAGTPLITFHGLGAVGSIASVCERCPVLADLKSVDGIAKYFRAAGKQGAEIATVMGFVPNVGIEAAVSGGSDIGLQVMADLYGVVREKLAQRSQELEQLGVHFLLLHAGGDEMASNPGRDPLIGLSDVVGAVSVPVGAVIFSLEQAREAVRRGASFVVQGEPLVSAPDGFERLSELVEEIHAV